jgi:hypothetical protein
VVFWTPDASLKRYGELTVSNVTIHIDRSAESIPAVRPLVEIASGWLEPILRDSPEPLNAEWTALVDSESKEPIISLRMTSPNFSFPVNRTYRPSVLADQGRAESALNQQYREFLRLLSKELLKRVTSS